MDRNECSSLDFQLGTTGVEATIPTRQWNIKVHKEVHFYSIDKILVLHLFLYQVILKYSQVTQIECSSELRAPQGCTQYLYGSDTNTVRSFNFDNGDGIHLGT